MADVSCESSKIPPPLPIPSLDQTIDKYLERIIPLLDNEGYLQNERIARSFLSGAGAVLDSELHGYSKTINGSWLKPTWDNIYLSFRDELNGKMNYATMLEPGMLPADRSFPESLAGIIASAARIYCMIADNTLPPDTTPAGPLCMEQYQNVFGSCRIPKPAEDEFFVAPKNSSNQHIVVFYRENIYNMEVIRDGKISTGALVSGIENILSRKEPPAANIGALTAASREEAAALYKHIKEYSLKNKQNLRQIETALFVLCIDDIRGRSEEQTVKDILFGYGKNRWFDKAVQMIAGTDGSIGFNNEHTAFDGAVWTGILGRIYEGMQTPDGDNQSAIVSRLEWELDSRAAALAAEMEEKAINRGKDFNLRLLRFNNFGADHIKKNLQASPDAFFHLALQLAWFRQRGRLNSTYEAVNVRHFHQGRTECMRPSTQAVLEFVKGFGGGNEVALSREAMKVHSAGIKQCQQGQGPERHLTGMQAMLARSGKHLGKDEDIFSSEGYRLLKHDTLSTSGMSLATMSFACFGPVAEDGFGISYNIGPEGINVSVTSVSPANSSEECEKLIQGLGAALEDLSKVLSE